MPRRISNADLQKLVDALPTGDFLAMSKRYADNHGMDAAPIRAMVVAKDLQNRLEALDINSTCPKCGSAKVIGFGKNGHINRMRCKDCGKTFTRFTDTILEKTRYHWDAWVHVMQMVLCNVPLNRMQEILVKDYHLDKINHKTLIRWRHEILSEIAALPMPKLSGIVQVDETFFREGQKGSRHLKSTIKGVSRKPRYGCRPSRYGVMGNEFANVVVATDLSGHCVAHVVGLGRLTVEAFTEKFDSYIDNPSYLCSDGNGVYETYCALRDIPLYMKPSNCLTVMQRAGYTTPDWSNPAAAKATEANNEKILTSLYNKGLIDRICNREPIPYKEFSGIKNANSLSLARVNQFHGELKRHVERNTKGVSTKYLPDYTALEVFKRNWNIDHGSEPSTLADAEEVLIMLLKGRMRAKASAFKAAAASPRQASARYMALLKEKTAEMRKLTGNRYFKYDEEDKVVSFNKKDFLYDLPAYKLDKLCSKYRIPHKWAKYSKVSQLLKKAGIGEDILQLIASDRHYKISPEDEVAIRSKAFCSV